MPLPLTLIQGGLQPAEAEAEPYKPDPADPPSLPPQEIARQAKQFYDDMQPIQRLWALCRDIITGFDDQYGQESLIQAGLGMAYFNRARDISFNITQPLFRNASSRLETEMPEWGARPANNSIEALAKAQADAQCLGYHWTEDEVRYALAQAVDWGIIFGTAALTTVLRGDDVHETACGPDQIRAEPGIFDPDMSRFLGVTRITTKAELKRQFPGRDDLVDMAPAPMRQNTWWGSYEQMPPDRVEVLEAYCRSGHWFLLCGSGGDVLAHGITPKRVMPVQILRYTPIPFRFFGMGMVEQAIPGQYAYSQAWNIILNNSRLMSHPKILIHKNSGVASDAFSSRAGEKVYYRNQPPTPWVASPLPQYAQQLPAAAQSSVADSTGIHPASTGKRTPGLVTGAAITAITAQDEIQFGMTKRDLRRAIERMGKVDLAYMQAFYPPEKVMRQFDRYGSAIAQELRATDLSDNPDVFIEADSLFREDVQARQERIMEFSRLGSLRPQTALRMMQTNTDPLRQQKPIADFIDAKKALDAVVRQGFQIPDPSGAVDPLTGKPAARKTVRFYPTDNFEVFADVTRQFIRSDEFNRLPVQRQDDVDRYYMDILSAQGAVAQGAAAAGPAPGKPKQLPGLPPGATPGDATGNAGPAALEPGPERDQAMDEAKMEIATEFNRV